MTSVTGDLPYIDRLRACLGALNEFVAPRAVLRYQADVVQGGSFVIPSPWTGRDLRPVGSFVANNSPLGFGDIVIAYRFQCKEPLWLISGIVKDGFPVNELYLPERDDTCWLLRPECLEHNDTTRRQLRALGSAIPLGGRASPALLVGHPNFAHNMWNELPGLAAIELSGMRPYAGLEVISLCQPILAFEEAFAALGMPHRPLQDVTRILGWQPGVVSRIGATQVTESFRRKLLGVIGQQRDRAITTPLELSLEGCFPVIWLSVRLDARTAMNQEALLYGLVERIARTYPGAGFVLDGFALPDDFDNPVYAHPCGAEMDAALLGLVGHKVTCLRDALAAREQEITAYISQLRQRLGTRLRHPIISTSGLRMTDAVYLGGLADYYICHAGTLQHKIAWTHNIGGIVHSNTCGLKEGAASWVADQVENGVRPSLVDESLVTNLNSIRSISRVDRNRDYEFVNVPGVVAQVLGDLASKLSFVAPLRRAEPTRKSPGLR